MANDLIISGKGTVISGSYNSVKISGKSDGCGDISAIDYQASGKTCIDGSLNIEKKASLSGKNEYNNITCCDLDGSGKLKVLSNILCKDTMFFSGALSVTEITAKSFEFCIGSHSKVANIKADTIKITKGENNLKKFAKDRPGIIDLNIFGFKFKHEFDLDKMSDNADENAVLESKSIMGKDINISCTNADEVNGDNVIIGSGCHIKKVFYRGKYSCDSSSSVEVVEKI
ncbi:hypothetical protein [Ruminococcus flavefaciens]|uniref:hypothetical protein n=1 Tax=Ruminococcus flavefaciens TaxID=1265 RepID=UPI00048F5DEC|nr:hypothetical protein [Ruminococcus flavefaciens]